MASACPLQAFDRCFTFQLHSIMHLDRYVVIFREHVTGTWSYLCSKQRSTMF